MEEWKMKFILAIIGNSIGLSMAYVFLEKIIKKPQSINMYLTAVILSFMVDYILFASGFLKIF